MRVALLVIVFMVAALSVAEGWGYHREKMQQSQLAHEKAQRAQQAQRARQIAQQAKYREERRKQALAQAQAAGRSQQTNTQCAVKIEDGMPQH